MRIHLDSCNFVDENLCENGFPDSRQISDRSNGELVDHVGDFTSNLTGAGFYCCNDKCLFNRIILYKLPVNS